MVCFVRPSSWSAASRPGVVEGWTDRGVWEWSRGWLAAARLKLFCRTVRGAEELLPLVTERAEDVGADTLRALGRELCAAQRLLGVLVTGG